MAESYQLNIVTPERTVYSEQVTSIIAPGLDGYFGVLAHHAPMLAQLGVGRLAVEQPGGHQDVLAIAGGFLEVGPGGATILADAAERQSDIDLARAEASERRARERLAARDADLDMARVESALARAHNRAEVARHR
jgi:F-type H+-transporting ATPase subunit epsilon